MPKDLRMPTLTDAQALREMRGLLRGHEENYSPFHDPGAVWERLLEKKEAVKFYTSGVMLAFALFFVLDSAVYSHSAKNGSDIHIGFVDWLPTICSIIGFMAVYPASRETTRLSGRGYFNDQSFSTPHTVLFIGIVLLGVGFGWSIGRWMMVYSDHPFSTSWLGMSNMFGNIMLLGSALVLSST